MLCVDLEKMVNNKQWSDVRFVVASGNTTLYAHSVILASRSEYFQKCLQAEWKEGNDGVINKADVSERAMLSVLRYIYTDDIGDDCYNDIPLLLEIVHVADEMQLLPLFRLAARAISKTATADNIWSICHSAFIQNNALVIDYCVDFIVEHRVFDYNTDDVLSFLFLKEILLEREAWWKGTPEIDKCRFIIKCVRRGKYNSDEQRMLLDSIRFKLIPKEFYIEITTTGLVPVDVCHSWLLSLTFPDCELPATPSTEVLARYGDQSVILTIHEISKLFRRFEMTNFKLLYRSGRDPVDSLLRLGTDTNPTLIVVETTTGDRFVGFTNVPWSSSQTTYNRPTEKSFIVDLNNWEMTRIDMIQQTSTRIFSFCVCCFCKQKKTVVMFTRFNMSKGSNSVFFHRTGRQDDEMPMKKMEIFSVDV